MSAHSLPSKEEEEAVVVEQVALLVTVAANPGTSLGIACKVVVAWVVEPEWAAEAGLNATSVARRDTLLETAQLVVKVVSAVVSAVAMVVGVDVVVAAAAASVIPAVDTAICRGTALKAKSATTVGSCPCFPMRCLNVLLISSHRW